ncbi:hypothetical protein KCP76_03205 [Salmonella enterica subsp. enterica serovar Weltevreden]|nr:hypothetical protein KCP76_03205 [Salmonella enterica subsp. enterica serovar Weltevreden]
MAWETSASGGAYYKNYRLERCRGCGLVHSRCRLLVVVGGGGECLVMVCCQYWRFKGIVCCRV